VPDSATALARSPLFSGLGRLDLAKLAGELEELHFPAGATIVEEGAPADGYYVINSGEVEVVAGRERRAGVPAIRLGPGEGFGEMALLAGSPRTATVAALTDVVAWRLSIERFNALLAHERGIAQSIERALSLRLAATTREAGEVRAAGLALAERTLRDLGGEAGDLVALVAMLPRWPAAALARACEATGRAAALGELEAQAVLVRDGERSQVNGLFTGLPARALGDADRAWLQAAGAELVAGGDATLAVALALRAGAAAEARRLLDQHAARLAGSATVREVDGWLALAGQSPLAADDGLADRLTALRARLAERETGGAAAAAVGGGAVVSWLLSWRAAGMAAALALFAAGWLVPESPEVSRAALVGLAAVAATVPLLILDVLPDYVVSLLMAMALVVPGLVPPAQAFGGFATPAWLMIFTLLTIGGVIARSGLMYRLVLLSLQKLPPTFVTQSLVLCATGTLLTAGISSGSARTALAAPLARGVADAMGYAKRSGGAAAIGLLAFYTFVQTETVFLTGNLTILVLHDLMPEAARAKVTWGFWLLMAAVPYALMFAAYYAAIYVIFRPQGQGRVNRQAIEVQRRLLGPMTWEEIASGVVLVALVVGFATRTYHGIAPAWIAVLLFLVLFVTGVLDRTALQAGSTLGLLVYAGVILGLGSVFTYLRIDAWLSSLVRDVIPEAVANPFVFVLVVGLIAFVLHFFVPWITASTILALVIMPIAQGLGIHPVIPVFVILTAGDHTFFPFVNSAYPILYFGSEGELFSHAQARPLLWLETLIRMGALLASVPYWRLLGLL
jgi:DASS family divalent anion:Na+ symporter